MDRGVGIRGVDANQSPAGVVGGRFDVDLRDGGAVAGKFRGGNGPGFAGVGGISPQFCFGSLDGGFGDPLGLCGPELRLRGLMFCDRQAAQ